MIPSPSQVAFQAITKVRGKWLTYPVLFEYFLHHGIPLTLANLKYQQLNETWQRAGYFNLAFNM